MQKIYEGQTKVLIFIAPQHVELKRRRTIFWNTIDCVPDVHQVSRSRKGLSRDSMVEDIGKSPSED